jgi:hypothetical protein
MHTPLGTLAFASTIALICGVFVHERCLAVAGILGLAIGSGWYLPGLIVNNARIRLSFEEDRVTEGDEITVNVRVEPIEVIPILGLTIDTGSHFGDDGQTNRIVGLPSYWPWNRGILRRQVRQSAQRRGQYRLDAARAVCSFPFRVREARTNVESNGLLIVWPKRYPIRQWPEVTLGCDDYGIMTSPKVGTSGDTTGLREFRRGDDPRRIHWPQTARLGHLVMREQQRSTNPRMSVRLESADKFEGWESDWAVRLAASFLDGAERMGWQCDLELYDSKSHVNRTFHGRETSFYFDILSGFDVADSMSMLESDAASDEIPREQLRLTIVSGRTPVRPSSSQVLVVLGEISSESDSTERPWLHFETESEVVEWLNSGENVS